MAPNRRRTVAKLLRAICLHSSMFPLHQGESPNRVHTCIVTYNIRSISHRLPVASHLPTLLAVLFSASVLPDCSPAGFLSCLPFGL